MSDMTDQTMPTLAELQAIRAKIAAQIHRTPMMRSRYLSAATGYDDSLKCELFQRTGSFKPRGMLARLFSLAPEERGRGAITFSAGNAAQGLAYAGGTAADAYDRCMEICRQENLVFVPSFDDPMLMRGHASLGLELIEDLPNLDAVVTGIGGGGLIGGIAMAREAAGKSFRLFGVEPEGAAGMTRSLEAGK